MSDPRAHHRDLLGSLVAGRRFVVAGDVLVGAAATAASLRELGAADVLAVGGSRGTGPIDAELERGGVLLGLSGRSIMDGMRAFDAALASPPQLLVDAIEAFDPDGQALVVTTATSSAERLVSRPVFGARPEAWRRLEDKTLVDALWDRAGVRRAPSAIVPADPAALTAAAQGLDAGAGTMWVADNRLGWHGGGEYVHWVRDENDAEVAARHLGDQAHVVRVMPFLDGLPCSIHGWAFADAVATFRPCEMVVLRVVGRSELYYGGAATAWHTRSEDLLEMRDVARRVGELLRAEVGYRGVFTVDGVMTAEGFRPTELNPRFGVGLALLGRATELPLDLLHAASVTHPELDWRPDELERHIMEAAASKPVATAHTVVPDRVEIEKTVPIRRSGDGYVAVPAESGAGDGRTGEAPDAVAGEARDGTLMLGPATAGGLLRLSLERFDHGRPVAPEAARAFALARELFELDLPLLEAAPDLRPA